MLYVLQVVFTCMPQNQPSYTSLSSVSPTLSDSVSALSMLITSFRWTTVNIIGSNDMYGRMFTSSLYQNLRATNNCISTEKLFDDVNLQRQIPKVIATLKSNPLVPVTVLVARPDVVAKVLSEARRQNFTEHVWIGTERWIADKDIAASYSDVLKGALGVGYFEDENKDFLEYLSRKVKGKKYKDWAKSILGHDVNTSSLCNQIIQPRDLKFGKSSLVMDALQTIANGLKYILENNPGKNSANFSAVEIRQRILSVLKTYSKKPRHALKIVNLKKMLSGEFQFAPIGSWAKNDSKKGKLVIDKQALRWPGGNKLAVPLSGPVNPCKPGTYAKKEPASCGWKCVQCPTNTYSQNYTSPECKKCPKDHVPDELQTRCIITEEEFIRVFGVYGICIMSASALGFVITIVVLCIFLKYHKTPVIKASNKVFCIFTLVLLLVWFLSSILFLGEPKYWTCKLRTVAVPLIYTSVSALLITKTKRLIRIFSTLKRNRFLSNYWYSFVACSIVFVQAIFSAVYLVFFPPKPVVVYHKDFRVTSHCSRNLGLEIASFSYNCLLAFSCTSLAVKSRKLPETYSEAKHICLTMLTYMLSWMVYFFGYYGIPRGELKAAVPIFGVIVGAYAVLVFIFVPKMRVILFLPEKNTKKAAMAATRKYSIDVACGIQLSISKSSRACERRHTLATLPTYHEAGMSSPKSLDRNANTVGSRFSAENLGEAIREADDGLEDESVNIDVRNSFSIPLDSGVTIKNMTFLTPNGLA